MDDDDDLDTSLKLKLELRRPISIDDDDEDFDAELERDEVLTTSELEDDLLDSLPAEAAPESSDDELELPSSALLLQPDTAMTSIQATNQHDIRIRRMAVSSGISTAMTWDQDVCGYSTG
jgi:hypothetical protein